MWSDNETDRDFVNFRAVADTAAEIIVQAGGRPLTMGVSGNWGVGKSSLIKLIQGSLATRTDTKFVFVEFNAWLYQGYDDARAALLDVIAHKLASEADKIEGNEPLKAKVKALVARVKWTRVGGLVGLAAASLAAGVPLPGLWGQLGKVYRDVTDGDVTDEDVEEAKKAGADAKEEAKKLVKEKPDKSPPQKIQDIRDYFEATLKEMGVTLVVLIDDLDRCLPATAIATLEAIRHFLFLKNTAFIIAADDKMIRQAVRVHFKDVALDDDLVTNYFDKLIQIPIRVPPLGTQDVRAYLMLLYVENSELGGDDKEKVRAAICDQLSKSWQGRRVDVAFVKGLITPCPGDLEAKLKLADRLAPLMTTSEKIAGNPRLIKRFLNTLHIRLDMARTQGVLVEEAALAKLLLFERCGNEDAYRQLVRAINESADGKPSFLAPWEKASASDEDVQLEAVWDDSFSRSWLRLEPPFADMDLRPAVYVSREHLPIVLAADQLSKAAADLLQALLAVKSHGSSALVEKVKGLSPREQELVLDRMLQRARQLTEETWGTPAILHGCLLVLSANPSLAAGLVQFLKSLPTNKLSPSIVPLLKDKPWAKDVLQHWLSDSGVDETVRKAISAKSKGAH